MKNNKVCSVEKAGGLDNSLRRVLQNPRKILEPHIKKEMIVLDLGCGPGFFSVEIAKILTDFGKVIAADLQNGMLDRLSEKIKGTELEKRITLHKCQNDCIGVTENFDFVLAFYMIHEVPDQEKMFRELKSILKPEGKIYIIEPKFHVRKKEFEDMMKKLMKLGFEIIERPKVFFSRTVLLQLNQANPFKNS